MSHTTDTVLDKKIDATMIVAPMKRSFFAVIALVTTLALSGCGVDFTHEKQRDVAFQEVNKIFVASGLCAVWGPTGNKCLDKDTMYWIMRDRGYEVEIYGVQDQKVLGQAIAVFTKQFSEVLEMERLTITAYAFSKRDEVPFITRLQKGSILRIDLRRY